MIPTVLKIREYTNWFSSGYPWYRIINVEGTLIVRRGTLGRETECSTEVSNSAEAHRAFIHLSDQLEESNYVLAVMDELREDTGVMLPPDEVEDWVMNRWRQQIPLATPSSLCGSHMVTWSVLSGLLSAARRNSWFAVMLEEAQKLPHAIDPVRDLCLIQIEQPTFARNCILFAKARNAKIDALDDLTKVGSYCSQEVLDTALTLYYKGHPAPQTIFEASQRLVGSTK